MLLTTETILEVLDKLEEASGYDLEELKFDVTNSGVNYELLANELLNTNNPLMRGIKFTLNIDGKKVNEKIMKVVYKNKKNNLVLTTVKGESIKVKTKSFTIDIDTTLEKLIMLLNL